jgi:hypothetical protein
MKDLSSQKQYIIDVSTPKCWNEVVEDHKLKIAAVIGKIRPLYTPYLSFFSLGLYVYKKTGGVIYYEKEIEEISKILDMSFNECLLMQLTYEFCTACTAAVVTSDFGHVFIRTMDWDLPELKDITVKIRVVDRRPEGGGGPQGRHIFEAITWAGFVGIFTGIRPGKYAVALNYRRSSNPSLLDNMLSIFKGYSPNSFFIRDLLTNDDVPDRIKTVKLVAPAYYTIMGDRNFVVIRDREDYFEKWGDDEPGSGGAATLIQTNCDGEDDPTDIMFSHERERYMYPVLKACHSLDAIIKHINQHPIKNKSTIYTVIMSRFRFLYFSKE